MAASAPSRESPKQDNHTTTTIKKINTFSIQSLFQKTAMAKST